MPDSLGPNHKNLCFWLKNHQPPKNIKPTCTGMDTQRFEALILLHPFHGQALMFKGWPKHLHQARSTEDFRASSTSGGSVGWVHRGATGPRAWMNSWMFVLSWRVAKFDDVPMPWPIHVFFFHLNATCWICPLKETSWSQTQSILTFSQCWCGQRAISRPKTNQNSDRQQLVTTQIRPSSGKPPLYSREQNKQFLG